MTSPVTFILDVRPPDEQQLTAIVQIYTKCFDEAPPKGFSERIGERTGLMVQYATSAGEIVGYKLGYRRNPETFYSWLGGVIVSHRRQGIARRLTTLQHEWCTQQGYKAVRTDTTNRFKPMLHLDLDLGFDVIGSYQDKERGDVVVMLEKRL